MSRSAIMVADVLVVLAVLMQASSVPSNSSELGNKNNNSNDELPLSRDDECHLDADGAACSLSALQTKGQKVEHHRRRHHHQNDHDQHHDHHHDHDRHHYGTSMAGCGPCSHHEEKITEIWETCAAKENSCCHACGVWAATTAKLHRGTGGWCPGAVDLGDKVVPIAPCGGVEAISANTSADFDSLWYCAEDKTRASQGMALIVNPWLARTQHHLHVVVKPLDFRGHALARRLEKITACRTDRDWQQAHFVCRYSTARLYKSLPPIFSEVLSMAANTTSMGQLVLNSEGQPTLASVGITLLYICGGKPVVIATGNGKGGCSIEHSITR
ncbi:unnamed protein product [Polarella glacialis]|uniref:Uncharacterized protein n=1 Tax=Polarella glacialis TaxID=89957 RepID=A0A813J7S4_POLGL|nr:unnamed protein product [Polarella glacialis]